MDYICIISAFVLLFAIMFLRFRANVKEWLLWAVTEAENYLGSGTGKLKLRYVYDKFLQKFPIFKFLLPFSVFSKWVDTALVIMREEIQKNSKIAAFVEKGV